MLWNAVIFGPHETPFEDGTFKLTLEFSEEYPNKHKTGREWELRIEVAKKKKMRRHVCGDVPEAAHYVDAVTTEKRIPWYELGTAGKYEVYKLSPFHGYLCSDENNPNKPEHCQDMKVVKDEQTFQIQPFSN